MPFDPFGDFHTAGYLRNIEAEKDLAIVKAQEKVFFEAHLKDALAFLRRVRGPVSYAHFRKPLPGIPAMPPLGLMAPQEGMRDAASTLFGYLSGQASAHAPVHAVAGRVATSITSPG